MARTLLISLLISLLTLTLAQAGETLSLRALTLGQGEIPQWHVSVGEDKYQPLTWGSSQPSAPLKVMAGKELQLYEKADDAESYKPARKVAIPDSAKELLLLGICDEDGGVELNAIADKLRQAKFNDWLVINLSEFETRLSFGKDKEPIELKSGGSGIYLIEGEAGESSEVVAQAKINEEFRKIFSTYWLAGAGQRSLILIQDSGNNTKVKRIIDFLPKDAE